MLSIINVIASFVCIRTLLFYYSRVYLLSLAIFWAIPFVYIVIRQVFIRGGKGLNISFISVLGVSGLVALLSTVVRGMYLFRWQVLLTLVGVSAITVLEIIGNNREDTESEMGAFFPYDFSACKREVKSDFGRKFKTSVVIVLSLVVLYLLLGPLEIYAGNILSFSFGYKTFLPWFILMN